MNDEWLSNTYLVADEEGGSALVIDAGGPCAPLLEAAERLGVYVRTLLLTHHHHDHVAEAYVWQDVEVLAHPIEAAELEGVDRTIEPGETLDVGGLHVETLHTPGPHRRHAQLRGQRRRGVHRRHALQGLGRRRARARARRASPTSGTRSWTC